MTTVSIIGLGAIGAAHAACIADASPGTAIRVIAEGDRAARLRTNGVHVNDTCYDFEITEPGQQVTPADLIIVAVKHHDLDEAIGQLAGHVGPGTVICSLLNGITSEEEISQAYPEVCVPPAVSVGIDAVRDGLEVRFTTIGRIEFGDAEPGEPSEGVQRLDAMLTDFGIPHLVSPDAKRMLWWKFLLNVGVNQTSALLEAPYGLFQHEGAARDLMISAQQEVIDVAGAAGVNLGQADIDQLVGILGTLGPAGFTSMAQDALANRRTEVDQFAGTVVALGEKYGIPTPVNRVLLQAFEAKHQLWGVA
ncbi:ketopantoate reductase family protein [Propionimicrobium sp. PCR01-08-3]|uniref:ketopantoate reductase family protein n=1 Tax=Propionimicrobium sp. PCR01-08-3 TaxID=3052086 RepID=UPI00255CF037|nr:ketopantoate reductase family protein [Propionimicrobium sp. PCR01-08-3]WIY81664.1 ketopantoate reductase family protein [Propionimicrobium sp. PCR01-08-3]